ncbi:MAG: tRNA (adenosine(37)-N6)-dimethylallyltransferase MiaA [Clostridia bacterium]|jgi:tRNA dimethylallyltransferase|nr:tRNA (adenosine(37)-N6)-dimethylallyltransferase MiaA [Clostridia bacterium]MDD4145617.1 tRNA (adenosine(37)-N6)-dimethylallyltransferase MiaA [Clostridia bacterium]MDD4665568.1 tRNA (adenosine(37)-N6)-dimethylallyltransferase MiaA [Clostridia bacterium]
MGRLQPLVVIVGPTASGKTKIAVDLALRTGGEIISGDSMQVYRNMDIGTAKIKPAETKGVPHHLLDIKDLDEPFSVAEFQKLAREKITEIAGRGKIPFLVGGTGLYIQAVIDPYEFTEQQNVLPYRHKLFSLAKEKGGNYLYQLLLNVDPVSAEKIHPHDLKRVSRALEYYHLTRKPISGNRKAAPKKSLYNLALIGLTLERSFLYQRIEQRVDQMMAEGLLGEVKSLLSKGYSLDLPAMQGLGYRQLINYLQGDYNLTEAVTLIKRETRRFAKRQLTWFRRDPRIKWFATDELEHNYKQLLTEMLSFIGRTLSLHVE